MAFLTVDALTLRTSRFRRLPDERGGGGLRRAINGQLRADVTWQARNWEAEVVCENDAEAEALYAAADISADVTLGGTGPGAVTARVEVTDDEYRILDDTGQHWRVLTLRLREQV